MLPITNREQDPTNGPEANAPAYTPIIQATKPMENKEYTHHQTTEPMEKQENSHHQATEPMEEKETAKPEAHQDRTRLPVTPPPKKTLSPRIEPRTLRRSTRQRNPIKRLLDEI